jgi:hypothetical protein
MPVFYPAQSPVGGRRSDGAEQAVAGVTESGDDEGGVVQALVDDRGDHVEVETASAVGDERLSVNEPFPVTVRPADLRRRR